jgi:hypothetical protein
VLVIPWYSDDATVRYYDLKTRPDLLLKLPEVKDNPELAAFLTRINAASFPLQTAKCDAWSSHEISPEEEIFGAKCKFVSYIDLLFAAKAPRISFNQHEALAKRLCDLLHHVPELAAAAELIIRRCLYHKTDVQQETPDQQHTPDQEDAQDYEIDTAEKPTSVSQAPASGFYITAYVSGFGDNKEDASMHWRIALKLLQHALVQVGNG